MHGSSGGIGTHVLAALLNRRVVDRVVCVGPSSDALPKYHVVSDPKELKKFSTSFYYPTTLIDVLRRIREHPGRYAITGVPCFHKAIRLLRAYDPILDQRIIFQLGLVCGQMKSAHYAEYLARRAGMRPGAMLLSLNFRDKTCSDRADHYSFVATWKNHSGAIERGSIPANSLGFNWAMSYFKPKACDYCDDVYAECADLAAMDAWIPCHLGDPRGTSLVIARSKLAADLLHTESAARGLALTGCGTGDLLLSQESALRHRRVGLRFRLALLKRLGFWVPTKRVAPYFSVGTFTALEMLFRIWLRRSSRSAFFIQKKSGSGLLIFNTLMLLPTISYRVFSKIRRMCESIPSPGVASVHFGSDN